METQGNDESLCQEAKEYYYAILCPDGIGVPETIARHVESCPFCREQIRRLRDTLNQADAGAESADVASDKTSLGDLSRQFEFLGETVTCDHVRPFLPGLAASSSPIRIPTPITVHVDNCPRCTDDRAAIEELGLSESQLAGLGRFYSQTPLDDPSHEGQAAATATALAAFSFDGATPDTLDHVCRCGVCRDSVYLQRNRAAADLVERPASPQVLLCGEISTADLFDYVLPFGLDAAAVSKPDGRRDAVATHLRTCRSCMERVQSLHRTIHRIAKRTDSGVHTVYQCQTDEELARDASEASLHRYPVHVRIERPEPASRGLRRQPRVHSRKRSVLHGTALAAALVVVGALFLLQSSTARGKNVGDLLRAVRHTPNVHITYAYPMAPQLSREMWVSSDLNKIVRKTGEEEWVEYDLNKRCMTGVGLGLMPDKAIPLSREHWTRCVRYMEEPLADIFSNVGPGDDLSQVSSVASERPGVSLAVYELTRQQRSANGDRFWSRWRAFIDPRLELPVKIEFSSRLSESLPWELVTVTQLSYPTTLEVESELKALLPRE